MFQIRTLVEKRPRDPNLPTEATRCVPPLPSTAASSVSSSKCFENLPTDLQVSASTTSIPASPPFTITGLSRQRESTGLSAKDIDDSESGAGESALHME